VNGHSTGIIHEDVTVNGVRLHVARAGRGPLILFAHGFPEFWYAWRRQLAEFASDHLAVAPDMRGFNLSEKPEAVAAYQTGEIVGDIAGLAEHYGAERFTLVGHDWGGAAAWRFAMVHPERLDRLVIINAPHPALFLRDLTADPAQIGASQYIRLFRSAEAEETLAADDYRWLERFAFGMMSGGEAFDDQDRAAYREAWRQPGALTGGLNWYRASPFEVPEEGAAADAAPRLDPARYGVRVPTLVIWGERDQALLPRLLEGLDEYVPDLRLERVSDASHWVVHEKPELVNRLIRRFITATGG
jgi:pimeloyl-ACP methyl ester carboxylesterase